MGRHEICPQLDGDGSEPLVSLKKHKSRMSLIVCDAPGLEMDTSCLPPAKLNTCQMTVPGSCMNLA